ncbi:hypothetical protein Ddye_028360 [Dipteronia dyeriana]|uniref:DUF4283 domain-containing protein n=1 Tax=Dipteronia dyeriana TaxID=168575 RepID=A0AAD9TQU2_9ROSI|nr:hypothetical protein Ddye_028360 [Dipteronia dyeriana]
MKNGGRHMFLRLIGKLLSNKPVNREAFLVVMLKIWRTLEGFEIEVIGGNTFSFTFKNDDDKRRILHGGPWSFDNALLVIEEPLGKGDIQDMRFNKVAFWIYFHRVPLICMTSEIGRFLGGLIGEVEEVDDGRSHDCVGKYIHVRVVIDITQPLRRMLMVDVLHDGNELMMLLRYEKLQEYCFRYGRLVHVVRDCGVRPSSAKPNDFTVLYGPWLRDSNPMKYGKGRGRSEDTRANERQMRGNDHDGSSQDWDGERENQQHVGGERTGSLPIDWSSPTGGELEATRESSSCQSLKYRILDGGKSGSHVLGHIELGKVDYADKSISTGKGDGHVKTVVNLITDDSISCRLVQPSGKGVSSTVCGLVGDQFKVRRVQERIRGDTQINVEGLVGNKGGIGLSKDAQVCLENVAMDVEIDSWKMGQNDGDIVNLSPGTTDGGREGIGTGHRTSKWKRWAREGGRVVGGSLSEFQTGKQNLVGDENSVVQE